MRLLAVALLPWALACTRDAQPPRPAWALALHGGAGGVPDDPAQREGYRKGLTAALEAGKAVLAGGGRALDAVEAAVVLLEDDPHFNAGRGAVFDHRGGHALDASIMDGKALACGAVADVRTVRHPILLARKVMEETRHVLLAGAGAEEFARQLGVPAVDNAWFSTPRRRAQWQRVRERRRKEAGGGTVGAVALDTHGDLAAATSTGGLTDKQYGRVGDSPIVGAGTYADNRTCAISGTGIGEEFIRLALAHDVSAAMDHGGLSLQAAAEKVVLGRLKKGAGGVIGVGADGSIAFVYSSKDMLRAAADANGRFEVRAGQ